MAYGIKYIMQFTSDRGNEIRIEVLKKDYQGEIIYKSLGGAPSLSIEQGDGAIKGSSLAFAMQADVEGELQELYTTDNKKFKVLLYRNDVLYWQGYLVPELYSENYVDPPYDVEVIASDQLGILKNVTYNEEDVLTSLIEIIQKILAQTLLDIQCSIHMQLSTKQGLLLETSYISAAAFNGQSCYDALNSILQSCNCCIMQIANEWIILSVTDATVSYCKNGEVIEKAHCTIGQMGNADVCPEGSVTMVNAPAIRGVTVGYNHTLRSSMLKNANCVNRSEWSYTPGGVEERFPGEIDMGDVVCKCYFWLLKQKNLKEDSSLQLWQDIALEHDTDNAYNLSFRYMFMSEADLLLLSVVYATDSNKTLYLTSNGWKTGLDKTNVNSYIHVTGTNGNSTSVYSMSDASKYQEASISFMLPNEPGALRIGFINCTSDYSDPFFTRQILVTDVYLTVDGVTGKTATTLVEPSATSSQEEMTIVYGEPINSVNAQALDMTYLRYKDGTAVKTVYLSGQEYSSYYPAIVQDFSRYYGVKKMQLQGALMGANVLHPLYVDIFSEKVLRLVSGQYDLLHDIVSVSIEEVPVTFVEYDLVVYAQENNPNKNTTTNSGTPVVGGGGESLLGIQSDGDVFVKNNRAITGVEAKFAALALPITKPSSTTEKKTYVYASNPDRGAIDLEKIAKYIEDQEKIWVLDSANGVVRTQYNVVSTQEIISGRRASGASSDVTGGGGISQVTAQMIVDALGYVPYSSQNPSGYITLSALNGYATQSWVEGKKYLTAIPSEYITETELSKTLKGYQSKITSSNKLAYSLISGTPSSLPASDVYNWAKAATKPTYTASEVGALSTSGGTIKSNSSGAPLVLDTDGTEIGLPFRVGNVSKAWVGYTGEIGAYLYNYASEDYIGVQDNGTPFYYNGSHNTLLHSGNYSSYALPLSGGTINGASQVYAPLVVNSGQDLGVGFRLQVKGDNKTLLAWDSGYGSYLYNTSSGRHIGILDSGTPYYYNGAGNQTLIHSGNIGEQKVERAKYIETLTIDGAYWYEDRYRIYGQWASGTVLDWKVDGYEVRVDKAKKLNTARTIWGQSFDGSANVSGSIDNCNWVRYYKGGSISGYIIGRNEEITGNEGLALWTYGNTPVVIGAGSAERMRITANGNILIGTTSDNGGKLQVDGNVLPSVNWRNIATGENGGYSLGSSSFAWSTLYVHTIDTFQDWSLQFNCNGTTRVRMGTSYLRSEVNGGTALGTSDYRWGTLYGTSADFSGNITATGEVISTRRATSSDARLKDNINRLLAEDCLAMVRNLQPSSWDWKNDGKHSLGFIAQDVEQYMPYAVTRTKDDKLGEKLNLQYDQFFAPVVGAIQCLDSEVEQLKKRVKYLENKLQEYGYNRY